MPLPRGHVAETTFAYGLSVFVALSATLLRHALTPYLGATQYPFIVAPAAVLVAAYIGGFGPGIVATVLTATAALTLWVDGPGLSGVTFAGALSTAPEAVHKLMREAKAALADMKDLKPFW